MIIKRLALALIFAASIAHATEVPLGSTKGLSFPTIPFPGGVECGAGEAIQTIGPDGIAVSCIAVAGGGSAAGLDTYVQYNNNGNFGADQYFTWNYNTQVLTLGQPGTMGQATMGGAPLASLGTPADGTIAYCTDCDSGTSPCTGSSTGSFAQRVNGAWECFGGTTTSPGGVNGNLQINNGSGGFGAFAGSSCSAGNAIRALDASGATTCVSILSQAYTTVAEEGSNLTQRSTLNFIGSSMTCADNGGSTRTDCTVAAYNTVADEGSAVAQQPTLNFIGSAVSCVNNGGSSRTDCTFTGGSSTTTYKWIGAAGCTNTSPWTAWDLPTSNPAVETCQTGSNTTQGILAYADGANSLSAQKILSVPTNYDSGGSVDVTIYWNSSTTTGDVVWQVATACVAATESNDPSFNTASTVTDTTQGTASRMNTATITGLTMTGCAADELWHLKVFRDPANGGDTMAGTANLFGIMLSIPTS